MPIHHVCLNVRDMDEAAAWYTAALKPLGYKVAMELADGEVKGFRSGRWCGPDMWLAGPRAPTADGSDTRHSPTAPAVEGGGDSVKRQPTGDCHLAFKACNRAQVRAFHEAALKAGGTCNGLPGLRPEYFATYYAAFVKDPEGRNIEAACANPALLAEPSSVRVLVGLAVAVLGVVAARFGGCF